jgi:hypothetical protein
MKYKLGDFIQFRNTEGIFMKVIALHNWLYYRKYPEYKEHNGGAVHTGIITRIENNKIFIAEAVGKPFQEFEYDDWWLDARIEEGKIWIRRPNTKLTNVYKHAKNYFGRKYDWMSIYGIFIKSLFGFKSRIANKFKGDKLLICSEGALRIGYDASDGRLNLDTEFSKDTDFIPPICIDLSKQFKTIK